MLAPCVGISAVVFLSLIVRLSHPLALTLPVLLCVVLRWLIESDIDVLGLMGGSGDMSMVVYSAEQVL